MQRDLSNETMPSSVALCVEELHGKTNHFCNNFEAQQAVFEAEISSKTKSANRHQYFLILHSFPSRTRPRTKKSDYNLDFYATSK